MERITNTHNLVIPPQTDKLDTFLSAFLDELLLPRLYSDMEKAGWEMTRPMYTPAIRPIKASPVFSTCPLFFRLRRIAQHHRFHDGSSCMETLQRQGTGHLRLPRRCNPGNARNRSGAGGCQEKRE